MMEIDWKKFMTITPETLNEDEINDICNTVVYYKPDYNLNRKYLFHYLGVIQAVVKFKHEQVLSLTNELDELATEQGKEEGSKFQRYTDEIERLRSELEQYRRTGERNGSKSTNASCDDFRREVSKLQVQNEKILDELKEKEKDLMVEKKEVERYASQVAELEREKLELKRELKVLQDENLEKSIKISLKESPEPESIKHDELKEIIRQKNKHITQLLEDVEVIENENLTLTAKLTTIKDELSETTINMKEMTAELSKFKHLNMEYENKELEYKEKINGLKFQIEELVDEKEKHDKQLDEYILMFNSKASEWKDILSNKDDTILKLESSIQNLKSSVNAFSTSDVGEARLRQKLLEQEKQMCILQEELQRATEEITSSTVLIEKLKEQQLHFVSLTTPNENAANYFEEKMKVLEEKLCYAEEDALAKAKEMSNLVVQLREYESNVFGLSEAVEKIKRLEKDIRRKDVETQKLIEICNGLEIKVDNLEEQNMSLRNKLGLSAGEEIDTSGVSLKLKKDEELLKNLQHQLDRKEEELLNIKIKYRKMMAYFKVAPEFPLEMSNIEKASQVESQGDVKRQDKTKDSDTIIRLQLIMNENDALRKGMHEILESIRHQSCIGTVNVQSSCLERLLEALDSRHISGWYHPAMRLQAQLCTEEGKNDELRNQIRSMRVEEKKRASELQNAYLKIQTLENDILAPSCPERKDEEVKWDEAEDKEDRFLVKVDNVQLDDKGSQSKPNLSNSVQEEKIIKLESKLYQLEVMYNCKILELEEKEKEFSSEREENLSKLEQLENELKVLKNENPDCKDLAEITSKNVQLERKINYLKYLEMENRKNNEKLRKSSIEQSEIMLRDILRVQNEKAELVRQIEKLEEDAVNAVPREKVVSLANELSNVEAKYKNLVSLSVLGETSLPEQKVTPSLPEHGNGDNMQRGQLPADSQENCSEISKGKETSERAMENVGDVQVLELRNKELREKVEMLMRENFKFREAEANLRTEILTDYSSKQEFGVLEERIKDLEKRIIDLDAEKENIQELFEISQGQCRAFQEIKDEDRLWTDSQTEQILILQGSSDDKATISRLYHEITMNKLSSSQMTKENNDLKMKISKFRAHNLSLEEEISQSKRQMLEMKKKHLNQVSYLLATISHVRSLYGSQVLFRDVQDYCNKKAKVEEKNKLLSRGVEQLRCQIQEYSVKKTEMETQLECLENLKGALRGDAKKLISWHNKVTELKVREAKLKRENEFLIEEVTQLKCSLTKLKEEISVLEAENIEKEKEWEEKAVLWESCQRDVLVEVVHESRGPSHKRASSNRQEAWTNTDDFRCENCRVEVGQTDGEQPGEKVEANVLKNVETETENGLIKDISRVEKKVESTEREAFKMTVESLERVIRQKEETILRYRNLLKEGRDEYGRTYSKLQVELQTMNETLAFQNRAYNKLKNAVQANNFPNSENIPAVVEKYIKRIQELEDELRECQLNLSSVNTQAYGNEQQVEKWRNLATERLLEMDALRQQLKKHDENHKEEVEKYQMEVERLLNIIENRGAIPSGKDENVGTQGEAGDVVEENLKSEPSRQISPDKCQSSKEPDNWIISEMDTLKRELKCSKEECVGLKEQIRLLQAKQPSKRPRTAGSCSARSDSRLSAREESLTTKIKNLEELLTASKEKEKDFMEMIDKKLKSTEEVARWDERKKSQQLIKNLSVKLKEKEAEVAVLSNKNESLRNMIYKGGRDKVVFNTQVKALKASLEEAKCQIEKIRVEKKEVEAQVDMLENKLDEQRRHSTGVGAALLQEKLECQERKLIAFELAFKGQPAVIEEVEKSKLVIANLEKANLRLEGENLSLQLGVAKQKEEIMYLTDQVKYLQNTVQEAKSSGDDRVAFHLKTVEKLKEENKRLQKGSRNNECTDRIRLELENLNEENNWLKQKYAKSMDRNIILEDELKTCRYKMHLLEEKNLSEILPSACNYQTNSDICHEIRELKSKLAQKNSLLNRVKELLMKAAAKEKALFNQVAFIQSEIPHLSG